jgi:hypothetical protein
VGAAVGKGGDIPRGVGPTGYARTLETASTGRRAKRPRTSGGGGGVFIARRRNKLTCRGISGTLMEPDEVVGSVPGRSRRQYTLRKVRCVASRGCGRATTRGEAQLRRSDERVMAALHSRSLSVKADGQAPNV